MKHKNYRYRGNRMSVGKKLLIALLAVVLAGVVAFGSMLGVVLAGSHDDLSGEPGYMVVLGCQVRSDGPSVLLQDRIDTAAEYLLAHPDVIVIAAGGQGPDEHVSEAEAIRDALVAQGVAEEHIYLEDQSHNTSQNLTNSYRILEELGCGFGDDVVIVSNGFHLARARMLAGRYGYGQVCSLAAPSSHTATRFMMYIREPLALVKSFFLD